VRAGPASVPLAWFPDSPPAAWHRGSGGSYAGASVAGGYAFAFITGTMGSHARAEQVENALRGCLGVPPFPD
jgi:hypothetical protein